MAGVVAAVGVFLVSRMIRRFAPERSERELRWGQIASSSMVALAHGTNDAQKTMGFISLALIANGVILASSHVGFPLSTTQVVSGTVAGSGVGRPGAVVNWIVARNIVAGWLLTLPAAAAAGAGVFMVIEVLGGGAGGTVITSAVLALVRELLWCANRSNAVAPAEAVSAHPTFGLARPEPIAA
jgi:PiT family inorganic phosphate transporter